MSRYRIIAARADNLPVICVQKRVWYGWKTIDRTTALDTNLELAVNLIKRLKEFDGKEY